MFEMNKLVKCPYCKKVPVVFECHSTDQDSNKIFYYVSCDNYNCIQMPMGECCSTEDDAINNWNSMVQNIIK